MQKRLTIGEPSASGLQTDSNTALVFGDEAMHKVRYAAMMRYKPGTRAIAAIAAENTAVAIRNKGGRVMCHARAIKVTFAVELWQKEPG